jgi:serine O-acetyltransferase
MSKAFTAAQPQIKSYDPIWDQVRREAEDTSANEPVLASLIYATILSEPTLEDAICHTVAHRLQPSVDTGLLFKTFREVLAEQPELSEAFRADIMAVAKRDPACRRLLEPLFYFKGFVALETYRFAHRLWQSGRKDFAFTCKASRAAFLPSTFIRRRAWGRASCSTTPPRSLSARRRWSATIAPCCMA